MVPGMGVNNIYILKVARPLAEELTCTCNTLSTGKDMIKSEFSSATAAYATTNTPHTHTEVWRILMKTSS